MLSHHLMRYHNVSLWIFFLLLFLYIVWFITNASGIISFSPPYRFHEHWRFVLQRLVFLSAFVVYLEGENLVTREEVAQILSSRYQFVRCLYPALSVPTRSLFVWVRLCQALKLHFLTVFFFHSAVEVVREKGFHLDVEDYLAGVLIMASELVSLHFSKGPHMCW